MKAGVRPRGQIKGGDKFTEPRTDLEEMFCLIY